MENQVSLRFQQWLAFSIVVSGVLLGLSGFMLHSSRAPLLNEIQAQGQLIVLTRNAPTTVYEGRDGPTGYEYELASAFAAELGVDVKFVLKDNVAQILEGLESGEGHIAAAGLTRSMNRNGAFRVGPSYQTVRQQLVCNRYGSRPREVEDLPNHSLVVVDGTDHQERLSDLRAQHAGLTWTTNNTLDTEELLEQVAEQQFDCTIGDSNVVAVNRRYYPDLVVPFEMSDSEPLVWLMPKKGRQLARSVRGWFASGEAKRLLRQLDEKYYGHVLKFDFVDIKRFRQRIGSKLPTYAKEFKAAAEKTGLPWTLLAAVAYQESHWNPRAKSPTGVRGIMMLTLRTAAEVGVKSRLNAKQSIHGGARYLAKLLRRVPESVKGADRLWFALAAYNVGFGHLMDARELAVREGKNPDSWADLKTVLPLLSKRSYYRTLTHGYARGSEPVRYVQRIRDYYDILEQKYDQARIEAPQREYILNTRVMTETDNQAIR